MATSLRSWDGWPNRASTTRSYYSDPPYTIDNYNNRLLELIDQTELLLPRGYLFIEEPSKAPEYEGVLATLSLKSSRRMGRSVLKQYIKT